MQVKLQRLQELLVKGISLTLVLSVFTAASLAVFSYTREGESEPGFGVVQVPMMLPRLLEVSGVPSEGFGGSQLEECLSVVAFGG